MSAPEPRVPGPSARAAQKPMPRRKRQNGLAAALPRPGAAPTVGDARSLQKQALELALIGNCRIAALVIPTGRIVWWYFPRFDPMAGIINVATRLSEKWEDVWCRVSS
jgi:hypothetical protein